MVYAPYNALYHDYIIVLFSVGENTLDKFLFRRAFWRNTQEKTVMETSDIIPMTDTLAETSIALLFSV